MKTTSTKTGGIPALHFQNARLLVFLFAAWLAGAGPLYGDPTNFVWTGAGGSGWSTATSWSPVGVPGPDDDATINSGSVAWTGDVSVRTLNFNGDTISGSATFYGTLNWSNGTFSANLILPAGSRLNITGPTVKTWNSGILTNAGLVVWDSGTNLVLGNTRFYNQPGGVWDIRSDAIVYGHDMILVNSGLITKTAGTGTATLAPGGNGWFENHASLNVDSGTLRIEGIRSTDTGNIFTAAAGAAVSFGNYAKFTDTAFAGPGAKEWTGSTYISGVIRTTNVTYAGTPGVVLYNHDAGSATLAGVLNWVSGDISATLTVPADSRLNITGQESRTWNSGILTNAGLVVWDSGTNLVLGNTRFYNQPGGVWDIRSDAIVYGHDMILVNSGLITKTAGAGTATLAPGGNGWFENHASLNVETGILRIEGNGVRSTDTGNTITAAEGATVSFGNYAKFTDTTFAGPGAKDWTGSTYISGTVRATNVTYAGTPGVVLYNHDAGAATLAGVLNWVSGDISATLTVPADSRLNITGQESRTWSWGALTNAGRVVWDSGTNLVFNYTRLQNEPSGVWDIRSDAVAGGYDFILVNSGLITKTAGSGTATLLPGGNGWFENHASLNVETGILRIEGIRSTDSGNAISTATGATVSFGNYAKFTDTTFAGPGAKEWTGITYISGVIRATNVTYAGTPGVVLYNHDAGPATLAGNLDWVSGNISATLTVPPDSRLNITGQESRTWNNGILTNVGLVVWDSGTNLVLGNTRFYNQPGGVWDIRSDAVASGFDFILVNTGLITKTAGTGTATLAPGGNGWFQNYGSLDIETGTVAIESKLDLPTDSTLHVVAGSSLSLSGGLLGTTTRRLEWSVPGRLLFFGGNPRQLEVMSQDLGNVAAGWVNNFVYGTLELTNSASVTLVDLSVNVQPPEALYAETLIVPAGCTLNLNGLHAYTRNAQVTGSITGGSLNVLPATNRPLPYAVTTNSAIASLYAVEEWTFTGQAGDTVAVVVDPGSDEVPAPKLQFAEASILTPLDEVLALGTNAMSNAVVVLTDVQLPVDGLYRVRVRASAQQPTATGNYRITVYETTPEVRALVLNEKYHGRIETPYGIDRWVFSAVAGQQVRFDLLAASASGVVFTLRGPAGWIGFSNLLAGSDLITLPSAGAYTLSAVGAGNTNSVAYAFRLMETAQTALQVGQLYTGEFSGSGQAQVFAVTVTNSGPLRIALANTGPGNRTSLYTARGAAPTRGVFDSSSVSGPGASRELIIPNAPVGTFYLLVYGDYISSPGAYTLQVTSLGVFLTQVTPTSSSKNSAFTMTLTGAGFEPGTTVEMINGGGASAGAATNVLVDSYTQITADFPASPAPAGVYSVHVHQPDGDDTILTNAFTLLEPGVPRFVTQLITPDRLGRGAPTTFYLEYANEGTAPMPAPLLQMLSTDPGDKPMLSLFAQGDMAQFFWSAARPPRVHGEVLILASGAQPGVLGAGERLRVPIDYLGIEQPWDRRNDELNPEIRYWLADDASPVDWSQLKESLRPGTLDVATWDVVYANLTSGLATTADYVRMLTDNARFLARLGQRIVDVRDLWDFEVQQAYGLMVLPVLDSAVDASVPAPGLTLDLARRLASNLRARNSTGWFGRGWYTPWQARLVVEQGGNLVKVVGEAGSVRIYIRDTRSNRYFSQAGDSSTLRGGGGGNYELSDPNGMVTHFGANGTLDWVEDPNGNRVTATYDGSGRLTLLTHTSGAFISVAYNGAGRITAATDSAGRSVTYSYAGDYLQTVTADDGQVTTYSYESASTPAQRHTLLAITRGGATRQFTYDSRGRLTSTFLAAGEQRIQFDYDTAGGVSVTDAGGTRALAFDHHGLLARVTDPLGQVTTSEFDSNLDLRRVVLPTGESRSFDWCHCGSLTSLTDESGQTTRFRYDNSFKRLTSFTDARQSTTRYHYDANGNLLTTVFPDNSVEPLANYTAAGLPLSYTNRRGQAILFTYTPSGQLDRQTFADGRFDDFDYDHRGNVTNILAHSISGPDRITAYFYDYAATGDHLRKVTYPNGRWVEYAYDSFGRRQRVTDSAGGDTRYAYDPAGRLGRVRDGANNLLAEYLYDAAGSLSRINKGNGTYTTYDHDAAGRLLHLVNHAPDGSVNSRFDYSYDSRGRPTAMTTLDGDWSYEYDATSQLIRAVFASRNAQIPSQDLRYRYDAVGNRIQTVTNGVPVSYAANALNQYTNAGGVALQYDADGNLTSDGTRTYEYDPQSRLLRTTGSEGVTEYEYDGLGNRTATAVNGQRVEYLLDPTGLGDVVAEFDGAGSVAARYIHGLGLAMRSSAAGQNSYYDFDALGSTASLTDTAGAPVNRYCYLPFGETLNASQTVANAFQFIGQFGVSREGNSLTFMRARYYHEALGRFASPDPIRLAGGGANFYRYSANAPTSLRDPSGLCPSPPEPPPLPPLPIHPAYNYVQSFTAAAAGPFARQGRSGSINDSEADALRELEDQDRPPGPNPDGPCPPLPLQPHPPAPGPGTPVPQRRVPFRNSFDPNEKLGARGVGSNNWVRSQAVIPYRIHFENLGPGSVDANGQPFATYATAPAQRVTISDQLDSDLDWSTFELADLGFGDTIVPIPPGRTHFAGAVPMTYNGQSFSVEIEAGLDLASGRVFVIFQSIVPETSLPPEVLTGFLPPEDGTGRGKGHVSYLVQARAGRPTGTEIRNVATIRFDEQAAITTNQRDPQNAAAGTDPDKEAWNTIDAGAPSSAVAALPAESDSTFPVTWAGQDDANGSGVAAYDIFVSTNNGPFGLWLAGTAETSALFHGASGKTYAFYSVARDATGNSESAPITADAQTLVTSSEPVEALAAPAGGRGKLPVYLYSDVPLTNVAMRLTLPAGLLTEPALESVAPELCTNAVQDLGDSSHLLSFGCCSSQVLAPASGRLIAWLHLSAPAGLGSGFAVAQLQGSFGNQPDGVVITNAIAQSSRMAIVGAAPVIEAVGSAGGPPVLTLFALTGTTNTLQSATNLTAPVFWQVETQLVMTNLQRVVTPVSPPQPRQFFRIRQP